MDERMTEPFRDTTLTCSVRAGDLLGRLTLQEKVGQLNQRILGWHTWSRGPSGLATTGVLDAEVERWGGLGALYGLQRADAWSGRDWSSGVHPAESAELAAMVRERVVAASRFGIPALFVEEAPHGHQALGSQLFPTNLGAAASWRPDLVEHAAAHTSRELAARGVHLALASGLDLLRDPRWGRAEECFGEDPLLASLYTRALVRGLGSEPGVGVVLKHFAGQGAAIGGRNGSGTPIGPREMAELHLPAARAGIASGAVGVMAAYNDVDGVPCCANTGLLTTTLREEWGFEGIVMADMFAVDRLTRSSESPAAAGAVALRAGVDLSMCDESYAVLEKAVAEGLVPEALVDRACRRVLELKLRLGLLDPPRPSPSFPPPDPAPELVASTAVLLRNRGDLLPLASLPPKVAVIGPNAAGLDCLLGDYVPPLADGVGVTVLDGIRALAGDGVAYEPGCELTSPIDGGCARAAALAAESSLVVLVLGSSSERGYGDDFDSNGAARLGSAQPTATTGEGFDAAEVRLPAAQLSLTSAVTSTGTPTVAVIVSGRPNGIDEVAQSCDAVLYAWYPGPLGGRTIAELILGTREPVGRLPVSLPSSSAVLPVAYNERLENTLRYVDAEAAASFPFGSGLGFTGWTLGPAEASAPRATVNALPQVSLTAALRNTGPRRGTQVVQLYARARAAGRVPRRAVLLGFTRTTLDADSDQEVTVTIEPDALPGLGLAPDETGTLDLWLSIQGAGEPTTPLTVHLG